MKTYFFPFMLLFATSAFAANTDMGLRPASSWAGANIMASTNAGNARNMLELLSLKKLYPEPNYTDYLMTDRVMHRAEDTFGGPGIWDPHAKLYRYFTHYPGNATNEQVWMFTSRDNASWMSPTVALTYGAGGAWDDARVGVPFVWYEPDRPTARKWFMVYRGARYAGTTSIGFASSTNGVTWERLYPDGTSSAAAPIVNATVVSAAIDHGNLFFADGLYWLYFNPINRAERRIYLASSPDLITWTVYGGGSPIEIWGGRSNGSTWDYDDATRTASTTNLNFGYFCGFFGNRLKSDGSKEYIAFVPSYTENSSGGIWPGLTVWTSPAPLFSKANRTFRGWIWSPTSGTPGLLAGSTINTSGLDVPRWNCPDGIFQTLADDADGFCSAYTTKYAWTHPMLVRPAGLPVSIVSTNYGGAVLSGVRGDLPARKPGLQLDFGNYAEWCYIPGKYGYANLSAASKANLLQAGSVTLNSSGVYLDRASNSYVFNQHTTKPTTAGNVTTNWTVELSVSKSAVLGAAAYAGLVHVGPDAVSKWPRLYYTGSAGDTAGSLAYSHICAGGDKSYTKSSFDWSSTNQMHLAFVVTNDLIFFYKDGVIQNAGGSAFATPATNVDSGDYEIYLGYSPAVAGSYFPGTIHWARYATNALYHSNFTPAEPVPNYATSGYIYSGVYDFGVSASIWPEIQANVPSGCTMIVRVRSASSATDRSVTWADFSPGAAASRYQQFAIELTGNGTSTPVISKINTYGLAQ